MLRRALGLLLCTALIGCGRGASEVETEAAAVEDTPGRDRASDANTISDTLAEAETVDPGAMEALPTGPYGHDSTLCTDATEALRALMPEQLEGAEPSEGVAPRATDEDVDVPSSRE